MSTSKIAFFNSDFRWEYFKTLISVFSGFITAFLAEPIKVFFTNRAEVSNLRRSIYGEIVSTYNSFTNFLISVEDRGVRIPLSNAVNSDFDCYKYAKSHPTLFYKLREASIVNQIYNNILLLKQQESELDIERSKALTKLILLQIEELFFANKKINKN